MLITEGVFALSIETPGPLKTVNTFLLKEGHDAYLVDTNWPSAFSIEHLGFEPLKEAWDALQDLFSEAQLDPKKLTGIIITHAHADHMGYLPELQALSHAPTLIHAREVEAHTIRSGPGNTWRESLRDWFSRHGTPDDIVSNVVKHSPTFPPIPLGKVQQVADGEKIKIGSMCWEVVWTPGHSPGHICLLEQQKGLLLTGDHVLPHDTPNIHAHPNIAPNPLGRYLDSLQRIEPLPVIKALPGHGNVIDDLKEVISFLISHHDVRFADVIQSLSSGPKSSYEVACEIPWVGRQKYFSQLSHVERWMALGETIAHLEALQERGKIKQISKNGGLAWNLTGK